ncbi:efflux RND transporter periplasmic adaptor subunit [Phreatobacter sp.]|uniref:efflux RND transporter periplasmic adaptor subunit n=1 Tax=Phreatobacter sp. TaxID=1966341 RepID=UPI0022C474AD|nr:efflux RND transporter periplasmic adaptor subunit [Phreatobacter sp.]MCZ8313764.1 efflux RND transporter periplasmic adaptor subunit [Phreatobacter sp.]
MLPKFRSLWLPALVVLGMSAAASGAQAVDLSFFGRLFGSSKPAESPAEAPDRVTRVDGRFRISEADWSTFVLTKVEPRSFREQILTEGRLAIDENSAVPVISPYAGRTTRVPVIAGDVVRRGQPLLFMLANEMVQTQNEFVAAISNLDKAVAQLRLAEINEKRQNDLLAGRAAPQRDVDQARADLDNARADHRAAVTGLEALENRLRLFGKTDAEIASFRADRRINPEIAIPAPADGTVVTRRVSPGQFLSGGGEPVFVIDDLDTLWLNIFVREEDVPRVRRGAPVEFRIIALRNQAFAARLDFISASIDATSKRLLVRATVDNPQGVLKQQMFASVTIQVGQAVTAPAVPRNALIYEGPIARLWVAHPDKTAELRRVTPGITDGDQVQIVEGVRVGEEVVVRGALFIDQMTAAFRR